MLRKSNTLIWALATLLWALVAYNAKAQTPPTVTAGYNCGPGTVTLFASGALPTDSISWYVARTGGTRIARTASGAAFVTPSLTASTYYFAAARRGTNESSRTQVLATITNPADFGSFNVASNKAYYWPLNSLSGTDAIGTNQITFSGNVTSVQGRRGVAASAIRFEGLGAEGNSSELITNPANFTISFWFKTTTTTGGRMIGFGSANTPGQTSLTSDRAVWMTNEGRISFGNNNFQTVTTPGGTFYNDGQWHHVIALIGSGQGTRLFVDGQQRASSGNNGVGNYAGYWRMGYDTLQGWVTSGNNPTNVLSAQFEGDLDEVTIYNRVFNQTEAAEAFNPPVNLTANSINFCNNPGNSGTTFSLANAGFDVRYYLLAGGTKIDSATGGDNTITLNTGTVSATTIYSFAARDLSTGCEIPLDTQITVTAGNSPPLLAPIDLSTCGGGSFTFKPAGATPGFVRWYTSPTGGLPFLTADSLTIKLAVNDTATFYVTQFNSSGCESPRVLARAITYFRPKNLFTVPTDSLKIYYTFNNSRTDASGNANNMTETSIGWTNDRFGAANGAANWASSNNGRLQTTFPFFNPQAITHSIWIRTSTIDGGMIASFSNIQDRNTSSTVVDRVLYIGASGRLHFRVNDSTISTTTAVNDGQWHHLVASVGSRGMELYVDGALIANKTEVTSGKAFTGYVKMVSDDITSFIDYGVSRTYDGAMDDYRFYTRQLSPVEIAGLLSVPNLTLTTSNLVSCGTITPQIRLGNSQQNVNYQLVDSAANTNIGQPVAGNGANIDLGVLTSSSTVYSIVATNVLSGCTTRLSSNIRVTINPVPTAPTLLIGDSTGCGTFSRNLIVNEVSGNSYRWYAGPVGGTILITSPNFTVTPNRNDSSVVYVSARNAEGCEGPRTKVKVVSAPEFNSAFGSHLNGRTITSGLITRVTFDDLSLNDISGVLPANNLTFANRIAANDRFGKANALRMPGSGVITSTRQFTNPNNFSISIWVKTNTTTGGKIFGFSSSQAATGGSYDRLCYFRTSGQIIFAVNSGGIQSIQSNESFNDGKWHLVTCMLTPSTGMRLYVDGVERAARGSQVTGQNFNGFFHIGGGILAGSFPNLPTTTSLTGDFDDFRIYGRALTADEVLRIYREKPLGLQLLATQSCGTPQAIPVRIIAAEKGAVYSLVDTLTGQVIPTTATASNDTVELVTNSPVTTRTTMRLLVTNPIGNCVYPSDTVFTISTGQIPFQPVGFDQTVCGNTPAVVSVAGGKRGFYRWYLSETSPISLASDSFIVVPALGLDDSTVFYVANKDSATGCESDRTRLVVRFENLSRNAFRGERRNLRIFYPFTLGTFADRSGLNNNGTPNPVANVIDTLDRFNISRAAKFLSGTQTRIISATTINGPGAGLFQSYSVSVWFKSDDSTGGRIIGFGDGTGATSGANSLDRCIALGLKGLLYFGHRTPAVPPATVPAANELRAEGRFDDNQWHHAVATYSAANGTRFYVDGVLVGANPAVNTTNNNNGRWRLGFDNSAPFPASAGLNNTYEGFVDDARIYNRELSGNEVLTMFNEPFVNILPLRRTLCGGRDSTVLRIPNTQAGVSYQLLANGSNAGPAFIGGADTVRINTGILAAPTSYQLIATKPGSSCQLTIDTTVVINVVPTPAAPRVNDTTRCGNGAITMRANTTGTGVSYRWYDAQTGGILLGSNPTLNVNMALPLGAQVDSVIRWVEAITSGCPSARVRVRARVYPTTSAPTILTPQGTGTCQGDSLLLSGPIGAPGYFWFLGTTPLPQTGSSFWAKNPGQYRLRLNTGLCITDLSNPTTVTFGIKAENVTITYNTTVTPPRLEARTTTVGSFTYRWFRNGVIQTGLTTSTVPNPTAGNWSVALVNNGCASDTTAAVPVGISGMLGNAELNIYPNPSSGSFRIDFDGAADLENIAFSITDISGRELKQGIFTLENRADKGYVLNLEDLTQGTYLIRLSGVAGQYTGRLIIKK